MISLWLKCDKTMLANSRENWSKGQNLNQRLLTFDGRFSKIISDATESISFPNLQKKDLRKGQTVNILAVT